MINVLQVIGHLGCGGDTTVVFDAMKGMVVDTDVHFDYLTHKGAKNETIEFLRNNGSTVYVMDGDVRELGIVNYYHQFLKTLRQADKEYDAIHVHTGMQSGVALCAAKTLGIPNRICHSHVTAIQRKASFLKKAIATPLFRMLYMAASTQKIACSKDAGSFLYGNNKTTQVIYNAIDIEPYLCISEKDVLDLRQELGILKSDVVIGHVARMCEMKNQKFIIELARRNKDAEHIKFLLVGDGQEFGVIQEMAKELPNVILTGRRSDVPTIMKSCDCIILPSLPGEGFPVTMIEAQAAGCCCITSAHVTDEVEVGLDLVTRIPLTDLESWDSSIVSLKRNSDFNHRDECARKLLEYGFGKDTFINKWKNLYN